MNTAPPDSRTSVPSGPTSARPGPQQSNTASAESSARLRPTTPTIGRRANVVTLDVRLRSSSMTKESSSGSISFSSSIRKSATSPMTIAGWCG
jgi:hypothetical protein